MGWGWGTGAPVRDASWHAGRAWLFLLKVAIVAASLSRREPIVANTTEKLDQDARYRVKGWPGIAFFIHGFPKRVEPITTLGTCDDSLCACRDDENELHEIETGETDEIEQDETCGRVLVVMVGDDTRHEVDVNDLTKLRESDYCHSCGQTGCGHDVREDE